MTETKNPRTQSTSTGRNSRYRARFRKGQTQPGLPLEQHPVWERLRTMLLSVTPNDLDTLPERFAEVVTWGHALMRAPNWQRARIGRHFLNDLSAQLVASLRVASEYTCDADEYGLNVVRHLGLTLPCASKTSPVLATTTEEEW